MLIGRNRTGAPRLKEDTTESRVRGKLRFRNEGVPIMWFALGALLLALAIGLDVVVIVISMGSATIRCIKTGATREQRSSGPCMDQLAFVRA